MAKLVIGTSKQTIVPAVVKEKQPVIDTLNVTPTTSAQTITAPSGTDGYSPVNVSAVTSAIDSNIQAGNIKQGVTILGVAGNYSGITPTGTLPITVNGTYDVTNYASADVNVPSTAPAHYVEKTVDANGNLINSTNIINLNGITGVSAGALAFAYYNVSFPANTSIDFSSLTTINGQSACYDMLSGCTGLTSVDLSGLTAISGLYACQNMFQNCSSLTSVDLSSLTTVDTDYVCYNMFLNCSSLTSVDLSSLTTISSPYACQSMFQGCSSLTSIDLSSLTTIDGQPACQTMFKQCSGLKTAKFNALNIITKQISASYGQVFSSCKKLESVEFGGLTASTFTSRKDQIAYLFDINTGSTAPNGCTVHFPSNFDPNNPDKTFDITTLTGYPTFGGGASYIHLAYDLPATE